MVQKNIFCEVHLHWFAPDILHIKSQARWHEDLHRSIEAHTIPVPIPHNCTEHDSAEATTVCNFFYIQLDSRIIS